MTNEISQTEPFNGRTRSRFNQPLIHDVDPSALGERDGMPLSANLPPNQVLGEQAGRFLRTFLRANGLDDWPCFSKLHFDPDGIDLLLESLGETDARWVPFGAFSRGGYQPAAWSTSAGVKKPYLESPGCVWLHQHKVVIFRYQRHTHDGHWVAEYLYAAESVDCFQRLIEAIEKLERDAAIACWQIVRGGPRVEASLPRSTGATWDTLTLPGNLSSRLQTEVVGFFGDHVARLYRELNIPYRRGVLLHGPAGNGKTSIIRAIGAMLPHVAAMLMRPAANFDADDFVHSIRFWKRRAPAMLVIEDLDWLLTRLDLSTFLNEIDGIEHKGGGMMLIATTNHPDTLDPAVNNRPGRFDVVVEVPSPAESLRLEFLYRTVLSSCGCKLLEEIAAGTHGLSFAHLREIVSLSGITAVRDGRDTRNTDDIRQAMKIVCDSHAQAQRGFPGRKRTVGFDADSDD